MRVASSPLRHAAVAAVCLIPLASGCKLFAVGDVHQIVVAIPTELRDALGDDLRSALEPRVFTSRSEAILDVAYVDPGDIMWERLRLVRHILLVGSASDPLVAEALSKRRRPTRGTEPRVIQVPNVWAKRQIVTIALLPADADHATTRRLLAHVGAIYGEQFSELIEARTTLTGMRTTAASRFGRRVGYSLTLPVGFRHEEPQPGVFVFRDDDHDSTAPLLRRVTVASRERSEVSWSGRGALAWREELAGRMNVPPQVTDTLAAAVQGIRGGRRVIELRGTWRNPPGEWIAAGPFITQVVECPDRIYLIDAWLYAPASPKYELIARMELILGTFRCAEEAAVTSAAAA